MPVQLIADIEIWRIFQPALKSRANPAFMMIGKIAKVYKTGSSKKVSHNPLLSAEITDCADFLPAMDKTGKSNISPSINYVVSMALFETLRYEKSQDQRRV